MIFCNASRTSSNKGSDRVGNMEDIANTLGSQMRQPKKRFVGRRTAEAQAQKDSASQADVESTAVQTGMQDSTCIHRNQ